MSVRPIHGLLKRSIVERIAELGITDEQGQPIQVSNAPLPPPIVDFRSVYIGQVQWTNTDALAERNVAGRQVIAIEVRIRVETADGDIDETERIAEDIEAQIAAGVCAEPDLLEGMGSLVASAGDSDPVVVGPNPEPKVIVNLGLTFTATVYVPGGA